MGGNLWFLLKIKRIYFCMIFHYTLASSSFIPETNCTALR